MPKVGKHTKVVGNQHARLIDSVLGLCLNNLLTNII